MNYLTVHGNYLKIPFTRSSIWLLLANNGLTARNNPKVSLGPFKRVYDWSTWQKYQNQNSTEYSYNNDILHNSARVHTDTFVINQTQNFILAIDHIPWNTFITAADENNNSWSTPPVINWSHLRKYQETIWELTDSLSHKTTQTWEITGLEVLTRRNHTHPSCATPESKLTQIWHSRKT